MARTARNVLSNWAAMVLRLAIGIWLTPFILSYLGRETFGLWLLLGSFLGYFGLMDLGVRSAVVRYAARERALGAAGNLEEVVRRALGAATAAAGAGFVGFALLGNLLHGFLAEGAGVDDRTLRLLVWAVAANLALSFAVAFHTGLLSGAQRYDLMNAVGIGSSVLRAAATIPLLMGGWGILGLAVAALGANALQVTTLHLLGRRLYPGVRLWPLVPAGEVARGLVRYGLSSVLLQLAVKIVYYTDNVVIAGFLDKASVAVYGIAATLIGFLRAIVGSMTNVLTPVASEMDARQDRAGIQALLLRGTSLSLALASPVLATFFLDRGRFVLLWVGPGFEGSVPVLWILALGQLVALPTLAASAVLYALDRHRANAFLAIGEAAANLVLSVALVHWLGIQGVAWGTTLPLLVTQIAILPGFVCRLLHLAPGRLLVHGYLRALGAGALYAAVFAALFARVDPTGFVAYFACVAAALVPYGAAVYLFVLDAALRRSLAGRLRRAKA